jgi:hypothetical protein
MTWFWRALKSSANLEAFWNLICSLANYTTNNISEKKKKRNYKVDYCLLECDKMQLDTKIPTFQKNILPS